MAVHGRPRFAKLSVRDDLQGRLQPYIRTLAAALPLSLMECAGWLLIRLGALEVLRPLRALPTTASPALPSLCDRLSNLGSSPVWL
jgi:hypothetical protein